MFKKKEGAAEIRTPWEGSMEGIPMHLDYFEGSMFDKVEDRAKRFPD